MPSAKCKSKMLKVEIQIKTYLVQDLLSKTEPLPPLFSIWVVLIHGDFLPSKVEN